MRKLFLSFLFLPAFVLTSSALTPSVGGNGLWGADEADGREVIPHKYVKVARMSNGLFIAGSGGDATTFYGTKWGLFDENGTAVQPVKYDEIGDFIDGVAIIRSGNKYGFLGEKGQFIIPCSYSCVGRFNSKGLVWVNSGAKKASETDLVFEGGKFGVLDKTGQVIVPVKFKALGYFTDKKSTYAHPFAGLSTIPSDYTSLAEASGSFGIYEYKYVEPRVFSPLDLSFDSHIVVSPKGDRKGDGIVDEKGAVVIPEGRADLIFCPSEGFVPLALTSNGSLQTNYYNVSAQRLVFSNWPEVDCITPFVGGRAIVAKHLANQFISGEGQKIGKPYSMILPSDSGIYVVSDKQQFGVIDNNGNEIIPPSYHIIFPMTEGKMLSCKDPDGLFGFIDASGNYVIDAEFNDGLPFKNGTAMVKKSTGWGLINSEGNQILACRWFSVKTPSEPSPKFIWVQTDKGSKYYCVDAANDMVAFPGSFGDVRNFSEDFSGVAFVNNNAKFGCINENGEAVVPCIMPGLTEAINTYTSMLKDGKKIWTDADTRRYNKRVASSTTPYTITELISESKWDY